MELGTARIVLITKYGKKYFIVRWMNHGNFLPNEPRSFGTEEEAREWCRQRNLRVLEA
jgi:hypothetical protein